MIGFGEGWKKLQVEAQYFMKIKKSSFFFIYFWFSWKGETGVSLKLI